MIKIHNFWWMLISFNDVMEYIGEFDASCISCLKMCTMQKFLCLGMMTWTWKFGNTSASIICNSIWNLYDPNWLYAFKLLSHFKTCSSMSTLFSLSVFTWKAILDILKYFSLHRVYYFSLKIWSKCGNIDLHVQYKLKYVGLQKNYSHLVFGAMLTKCMNMYLICVKFAALSGTRHFLYIQLFWISAGAGNLKSIRNHKKLWSTILKLEYTIAEHSLQLIQLRLVTQKAVTLFQRAENRSERKIILDATGSCS